MSARRCVLYATIVLNVCKPNTPEEIKKSLLKPSCSGLNSWTRNAQKSLLPLTCLGPRHLRSTNDPGLNPPHEERDPALAPSVRMSPTQSTIRAAPPEILPRDTGTFACIQSLTLEKRWRGLQVRHGGLHGPCRGRLVRRNTLPLAGVVAAAGEAPAAGVIARVQGIHVVADLAGGGGARGVGSSCTVCTRRAVSKARDKGEPVSPRTPRQCIRVLCICCRLLPKHTAGWQARQTARVAPC